MSVVWQVLRYSGGRHFNEVPLQTDNNNSKLQTSKQKQQQQPQQQQESCFLFYFHASFVQQ